MWAPYNIYNICMLPVPRSLFLIQSDRMFFFSILSPLTWHSDRAQQEEATNAVHGKKTQFPNFTRHVAHGVRREFLTLPKKKQEK